MEGDNSINDVYDSVKVGVGARNVNIVHRKRSNAVLQNHKSVGNIDKTVSVGVTPCGQRAETLGIAKIYIPDLAVKIDFAPFARNLIGYAHDRGIRVIAEGVETPSELKAVIELGVDYLQGYLIGKPAAQPPSVPADIQELIRTLAGTSC